MQLYMSNIRRRANIILLFLVLVLTIEKGTWAFLSIRHLKNPFLPHEIQDDLESFFWVAYISLRRFKTRTGPIYYCLELFNEIKYEAMPGYPHHDIPTDGSYKDVILLDGGLTSNEFFSTAVRTFLYLPVDEFSDYSSNIRVP